MPNKKLLNHLVHSVLDDSMAKKLVTVVFGTRPEFLKFYPVIRALDDHPEFDLRVLNTAQHRQMVDDLREHFPVKVDVDLDLMRPDQHSLDTIAKAIPLLRNELKTTQPNWVLVQGDTNTAMITALTAFHLKIPVGHVEAGLRSFDLYNPFPEEANRKIISSIATKHFTPTHRATEILLKEGVKTEQVYETGNTVVDQLQIALKKPHKFENPKLRELDPSKKIITVTAHRRENHGHQMEEIAKGILGLVESNPDIQVVFPVHPNPNVRKVTDKLLSNKENILTLDPIGYLDMVNLLKLSHFILTDSGGLQEEAPSLQKPVLILRETTERPEAVDCGCALIVGTSASRIIEESQVLLDPREYEKRTQMTNPFGDGQAAQKIVEAL